MSYSLNLYAENLENIRRSLSKPDTQWMENSFSEWLSANDLEPNDKSRAKWNELVFLLVEKIQQNELAAANSSVVESDLAEVFCTCIDCNAQFLESLNHSSSSGDMFREEFLTQIGQPSFKQPDLTNWLIDRPMFGLAGQPYPSWGYLRLSEIEDLLRNFREPEVDLDEDFEGWMEELRSAFTAAQIKKSDIVTIYT